jgi:hypothetical protein
MTRNPYAPPTVAVDEVLPSAGSLKVDTSVALACKLLWWLFAVQAVVAIPRAVLAGAPVTALLVVVGIGSAFGYVITLWVAAKLKAGRNWMRLTVTAFAALVTVTMATVIFTIDTDALNERLLLAAYVFVRWIFIAVIAALINMPRARAWFLAMNASTYRAAQQTHGARRDG